VCGLAGFVVVGGAPPSEPEALLAAMGERIAHRGPDGAGVLWRPRCGVGLAHRRLAVQDLSPAGAQPMASASGRYQLVFNGELYNFVTLRERLASEGARFRGRSDTEVMLAAFERWGVEAALERFVGMFALAVLDEQARRLWLVRDRLGEKPLYWARSGDRILFASELAAFDADPQWRPRVDREGLALLLAHGVIPAPRSIFEDCGKVLPGSWLCFELEGDRGRPRGGRYWAPEPSADAVPDGPEAALDQLEGLLRESIAGQLIADVPVGAFLSGGIDSSLVVALAQQSASVPVRTFSVGFEDPAFDESTHAAAVAEALGTDHTTLRVRPEDALALVADLPRLYSEPFADASQIPTALLARLTRQHVTVALSGDGGDELFAGYDRYPAIQRSWQGRHSPRRRLEAALLRLPDRLLGTAAAVGDRRGRLSPAGLGEKLARRRNLARAEGLEAYYADRIRFWSRAATVRGVTVLPAVGVRAPLEVPQETSGLLRLQLLDLSGYLPDDILVKVDRAAMAVALETRIPLLDHRVVEFALGVPDAWKLGAGGGKQLLRGLLARHLDPQLFERPKQGFAVPLADWLRGPLREWAEAQLSPDRLRREGLLDPACVRGVWGDHLAGHDFSAPLWNVLVFQAWLEARTGA
jgi:asparagine synthase (glutamine-hydrolysing)